MVRSMTFLPLALLAGTGLISSPFASEKAGFTAERSDIIPPLEIYKTMASDLQPDGWITFQSLGGQQIISFAPVMSLRCRLSEINYSIDTQKVDRSFPIPPCDREYPFRVEAQSIHKPYSLEFEGGTVQALAVQLTWDDGTKSEIAYYEPCRSVGAAPCAYPLGRNTQPAENKPINPLK